MADITNKNELKRRIELFLDELDYSINEDFCKETMKMMREFIGHASHRLDCKESRVKSLKSKLKNYKDLEEQGLLLRLPVKIGDAIYAIRYGEENNFIVVETKIIEIRQNVNGIFFEPLISHKAYKIDDFGKEIFLTQEEAEQKLKEMESD